MGRIGKIAGLFLMLFSIFLAIFFIYRLVVLNQEPEPYEINFPCFGGRILAEEEIDPPEKFSQKIKFNEAICWGKEATLVQGCRDENLFFRIWRPDPAKSGEFQYAEKEYKGSEIWNNFFWEIDILLTEIDENKFIFIPKRSIGYIIPLLVCSAIVCLFFYCSLGFIRGKN